MSSRLVKKLILFVFVCLICGAATVPAQKLIRESRRSIEKIQIAIGAEKNIQTPFETIERIDLDADFQIETAAPDFRSDKVRGINHAAQNETVNAPDKANHQSAAAIFPDDNDTETDQKKERFNWRAAIGQSLMFLAVQHGYAMTQPKTQEALKRGAFWRDYKNSVKSLRGWDDGGRFFTNYLAHPMQGSFTGFIYVQNDPKARRTEFGATKDYWTTRMKALLWTTAWSTQFEIGPVSQASIGNVGLSGKQTWEDIIVTPTVGTAWLVGEDAVDRFVIQRIERSSGNFYVKIFARMLLNPTRNFSNMFRFKPPWHRDRPTAQ